MNKGFQLNALDPNSLGDLKRLARSEGGPDAALRAAAKQFEGLFLQMVMKSMRATTGQNGMMDSEQTRSWQGMLDQHALTQGNVIAINHIHVAARRLGKCGTGALIGA